MYVFTRVVPQNEKILKDVFKIHPQAGPNTVPDTKHPSRWLLAPVAANLYSLSDFAHSTGSY